MTLPLSGTVINVNVSEFGSRDCGDAGTKSCFTTSVTKRMVVRRGLPGGDTQPYLQVGEAPDAVGHASTGDGQAVQAQLLQKLKGPDVAQAIICHPRVGQ